MQADLAFDPEERLGSRRSGLRVQWLGTAGFLLQYEQQTILIDPYVTRTSVAQCVLGPVRPDLRRIAQWVPRADAIVVGHTHFDHVLDVPAIAQRTGAHVYGSQSASRLCLAQGVQPDRLHVAESGRETSFEIGRMRVRFVPSEHAGLLAGRAPFPGEMGECGGGAMRVERYRCGQVFAIEIEAGPVKLVHLGSAHVPAEAFRFEADVVLLCTAGWRSARGYPERVARVWAPRAVVLSHWDNFFMPIEQPARPLPGMRLGELAARLRTSAKRARVGALDLSGAVRL